MTFTEHNQPNDKIYAALLLGCILCIAAFFITVCSSCKSAEKKQAKMYGKFVKLDIKANKDSATKHVPNKWSLDKFPVTIGKGKIVYLPGKKIPVPVHDTEYIQIDCDSAIKALGVGNGKVKIKPRDSIRVDTFYRVDTILDNRPLTQLQHDYRQIDAKLIQAQAKEQIAKERLQNRTGKMWWSIGLNLLLLLLIAIFILRRIGIIR